jgi:hypothetical protein
VELKIKLSSEDIKRIMAVHHTIESVLQSTVDDLIRLGLARLDATYVHEALTELVGNAQSA